MKIIVIASPRTASTWFCKKLANDHNIKNFNELFTNQLKTSHLSVHLVSKLTNELIEKDSGVFKVMLATYNGANNYPTKNQQLLQLCASADKIYYLHRHDHQAQLRSAIIAGLLDNWHNTVLSDDIINVNVTHDLYNATKDAQTACFKQIEDFKSIVPGETVYTEDIIQHNYEPYKQKYNLNVV